MTGKLTFKEEICKGCGLCVTACPKKILELSKTRLNRKGHSPVSCIKPEECIGCACCAMMCPDSVITVER
ncbi:MAG: 4Fe-4S binding protein [Kiritimatiellae bacterium]|jgi:2-oxoglutarate ferredoxin oxidoreductase subunit delta|nr:4Fe-4S binding protein [Kiritimatiellia bacterium]MBO7206337.1 4Fe-4S binding protein [Kiritimatiellia bacterium]